MGEVIYSFAFLAFKFYEWFFLFCHIFLFNLFNKPINKPRMGIEPMTFFLPRKCSATELSRQTIIISCPNYKLLIVNYSNFCENKNLCGQGGIRTPVDRSRVVYSHVQLTTLSPTHFHSFMLSQKFLLFNNFSVLFVPFCNLFMIA